MWSSAYYNWRWWQPRRPSQQVIELNFLRIFFYKSILQNLHKIIKMIEVNYRYIDPKPETSMFREASFGHGILEVVNATHALWSWQRNDDDKAVTADSLWFTSLSSLPACNPWLAALLFLYILLKLKNLDSNVFNLLLTYQTEMELMILHLYYTYFHLYI